MEDKEPHYITMIRVAHLDTHSESKVCDADELK